MAGGVRYHELTEGQRQIFRTTTEIYQAYLDSCRQSLAWRGGMHWKKIRGKEYLYRYRDRFGRGRSLGPRTEETERLYGIFSQERREIAIRLREQRRLLAEQARFCRAARIHRVPRTVAKILRRLEQHDLGRNLLVVGTAAMFAYEFAAAVFLGVVGGDLGQDAPRRLSLASEAKISPDEVLRLLRQVDRSFAPVPGEDCLARSRDGFLVRLLKSDPRQPGRPKAVTVPGAREPLPPEAGQIQYLLASPRFSQVVIGQDGGPATLTVPDPWAFALNKLWWSQQEDRDAATRTRDRTQALAVAGLVLRYLPQYDFSPSELDRFPRDLEQEAESGAEDLFEDDFGPGRRD
jgi:hypothetical protein